MSPQHLLKAGLTLSLGLLMAGWLMTSAADAGGKGKGKGKNKNAGGEATIINELQATKALLAMTNHDYKGHRVAAIHQVMHAIHLLQHKKHHPNPAGAFTSGLSGAQKLTKEQQQVSDAQVAQAMNQLQVISNQLQQLPGNHNHHQQALKAVHHAIHSLQTALKVA